MKSKRFVMSIHVILLIIAKPLPFPCGKVLPFNEGESWEAKVMRHFENLHLPALPFRLPSLFCVHTKKIDGLLASTR
jgi:hypothetical protein